MRKENVSLSFGLVCLVFILRAFRNGQDMLDVVSKDFPTDLLYVYLHNLSDEARHYQRVPYLSR